MSFRKFFGALVFTIISSVAIGQSLHNEWIDYGKTYYKFKVGSFGTDVVNGSAILKKGIVRIPYATIAGAGLGAVPSESFQLWRDGEEVTIYASKASGALSGNDYIEFWGEVNNGKLDKELYKDPALQLSDYWSLQTDTAAYFLTVNTANNNKRFQNQSFSLTDNTLPAEPYFIHTIGRYFRTELLNGFSAVAGQNIYSSSYDMGEGFTSRAVRPNNCGTQPQLPQNFFNLYPYQGTANLPAPDMTMRLNCVGNAPNSRTVKVLLNNDSITRFQMDYFYDNRVEENIALSKINSGTANFVVINESSTNCDQLRISMIELSYARQFNFNGANTFSFNVKASGSAKYIEIKNFDHGGVAPVIYDIANGNRYIGNIETAGVVKLLLEPTNTPYQLVINSQAGTYYKTISNLQSRNFTNFANAANQGDYLIISNPLIYGSGSKNFVQQYSDYRKSAVGGSYNPIIVDVNELVDQFAWGIKKHPLSVKGFLKYARANFSAAPKFVFLLGKGLAYNSYRNNEGNALADQLNLVPSFGYPASDNMLSSKDLTALPETPIGRLSAVTAEEVGDYLQKVKQYDSAQNSSSFKIEDRSWMKNVLQIAGANDLGLGNQLDGYLDNYKNIITDTAFGANVTNFSKNANPEGYTDAIVSFKHIYEKGSSLITYFGHSSSTSLDFNLDNPSQYNNQNKYPVFIANGCNAGNNFDFETNRFNSASTISEKFVLAPQRGSIAYLATSSYGVVNYLNMYTTQFYKAFTKTRYNQPIGVAIKEGIRATLQSTGSPDYFSRVHAEQYALNGDPALKLNAFSLPDYAVGEPQVSVKPDFISVADSNFFVKVKVYNLGRSSIDSVDLKLNRIFPSGEKTTLLTKRLAPLDLYDSVELNVPVLGITYKGINKLEAILDYNNQLTERTKENNSAIKEFLISEDEIRPIFPYNNAIVNNSAFKFQASTVNPLSDNKEYVLQIDTTELFNSALKKEKRVISVGGVVSFDAATTLMNNTVYYWRVSPVMAVMNWRKASFRYEDGAQEGFEQSHFYQHAQANLHNIYLDSADRKFKFNSKTNNLFIINSIYPTSGTDDSHFSVSVNGNQIISSACDGPVFQFNVFDPVSFKPWKNVTTNGAGLYGSGPSDCAESRQYNFEYRTYDSASRRKAMAFMDMIPTGAYVVVRAISSADNEINSYVDAWKTDTIRNGSGNSMYHRLKSAGFATIDSFYRARTFSFVYKKNDPAFAPKYVMSNGVNDRINLDVNCPIPDTTGNITSINYGPAKAWKTVKWAGATSEPNNDLVKLKIMSTTASGADTLIYTMDKDQTEMDISAIDASVYRYLKLSVETTDGATATPYQLNYFKVTYDAAPEGGLAPNLYINFPDTLYYMAGKTNNSNEHELGVAFKNASKVAFDSLAIQVFLFDEEGNKLVFKQPKTRELPAGDTVHVKVGIDATGLSGYYNVYLNVNPDKHQPEQFNFNNFMYKRVYIQGAATLPVTLLDFSARLQQSDVHTHWTVNNQTAIKNYVVEHSQNGQTFTEAGTLLPVAASSAGYQFIHTNAPKGKNYYRLKIVDSDGGFKYSAVRVVNISSGLLVTMYPNPVRNILNINLSTADATSATVSVLNAFGQQLLQTKMTGKLQLDMSRFASGTYMIKVDDGINFSIYKVQKQ